MRYPQFCVRDSRTGDWSVVSHDARSFGLRTDVTLVWCGRDATDNESFIAPRVGDMMSRCVKDAIVVAMDANAVTFLDRLQVRHVRMSDLCKPRPEKSELIGEELATGRMMAITNANFIIENERLKSEVRALRTERISGKARVSCDSGWDD